jgi:hypothetical protein
MRLIDNVKEDIRDDYLKAEYVARVVPTNSSRSELSTQWKLYQASHQERN